MSSISDVLSIASSGLATAQAQVSATSDNIANVNTPGYARKIVNQSETVVGGQGLGVHVDAITRAYNAFLQKASLQANASAGSASILSNFLDQAQQMFGDPSSSTNFFSGLDDVYTAFSAAAGSPSSSLDRQSAVNSVSDFLNSASDLSTNLSALRDQANQQTGDDVNTINSLLSQISALNTDIARVSVGGGDASGSQNQQSQLLTQLSNLINVQVSPDSTGGVVLRSQDGVYLAGDQGAATLSFSTAGGGGLLTATPPKGQPMQITPGGGEVGGLMQLSGVDIPQQLAQLGEFVSQAVSQINAASNASTSVPAPNTLTGSQIGQTLPTAIAGFSGKTTIAITDSSGVMQQRVDIDFSAGTMSISGSGGATSNLSFTSANFLSQLNSALGSQGSASFVNGALSIKASSSANGVAIADNSTTPSSGANGQGFSQFFGLNNLVQSSSYTSVNSGVTSATPSTFAPGGTLTLELTDANGAASRQVNLTIPTGSATTVGDLINSLNANVGAYGSFALDSQGHVAFTPNSAYTGTTVSVINDATVNTAGGPSLSQMLNIGWNTQADRAANTFSVRSDIASDPTKLQLAQLDLTQTVNGSPALAIGDGRGASAIAASGSVATNISAAGGAKGMKSSVSDYGSVFAGQVGAMATDADSASQSAGALQTTATAQLSSATGVNLDTELVNLTTYQQSYNASARLVQAAKDMYDTLLQMV